MLVFQADIAQVCDTYIYIYTQSFEINSQLSQYPKFSTNFIHLLLGMIYICVHMMEIPCVNVIDVKLT